MKKEAVLLVFLAVILFFIVWFSSLNFASAENWQMNKYDAARTGYALNTGPENFANFCPAGYISSYPYFSSNVVVING